MNLNLPHDLVQKTEIPEQNLGDWVVQKFEIDEERASFFNMRQAFGGAHRYVRAGSYTKLGRLCDKGDTLWMSDTPAEIYDHHEPARHASGHCVIGGLGLGIVVEACLRHTEVTKVTVLELEPDIIKMVGGYLHEKWGTARLEFIQCDLLEWKPPKNARYGMAWFDIWPSICQDNWPDMNLLHRRYGKKAAWKGSWGRTEIVKMNREDRGGRYW